MQGKRKFERVGHGSQHIHLWYISTCEAEARDLWFEHSVDYSAIHCLKMLPRIIFEESHLFTNQKFVINLVYRKHLCIQVINRNKFSVKGYITSAIKCVEKRWQLSLYCNLSISQDKKWSTLSICESNYLASCTQCHYKMWFK